LVTGEVAQGYGAESGVLTAIIGVFSRWM